MWKMIPNCLWRYPNLKSLTLINYSDKYISFKLFEFKNNTGLKYLRLDIHLNSYRKLLIELTSKSIETLEHLVLNFNDYFSDEILN